MSLTYRFYQKLRKTISCIDEFRINQSSPISLQLTHLLSILLRAPRGSRQSESSTACSRRSGGAETVRTRIQMQVYNSFPSMRHQFLPLFRPLACFDRCKLDRRDRVLECQGPGISSASHPCRGCRQLIYKGRHCYVRDGRKLRLTTRTGALTHRHAT